MYIMNIYLFFTIGTCILFCRGLIKCLDPQGPNVCPRYVITREVSTTKRQIQIACCPNYYEYEDACKECQAGTYGDNCSETCLPNYYGAACKYMCNCNTYSKCDPVKGCVCNESLTGTDCKDSCPEGWYGRNCSYRCACSHDGSCDPTTGICVCPPGLHGPNCSESFKLCTVACPVGWYGRNCSKRCTCSQNASCHPNTGDCVCLPGWYGSNCSQKCPEGHFGERCQNICSCPANIDCDTVTGKCKCHTGSGRQCHEDDESKMSPDLSTNYVVIYIVGAAILLLLLVIVTAIVKVKTYVWNFFQFPRRGHKSKTTDVKNSKGGTPSTSVIERSPGSTGRVDLPGYTGNEIRYAINTLDSEENDYCEINDVISSV